MQSLNWPHVALIDIFFCFQKDQKKEALFMHAWLRIPSVIQDPCSEGCCYLFPSMKLLLFCCAMLTVNAVFFYVLRWSCCIVNLPVTNPTKPLLLLSFSRLWQALVITFLSSFRIWKEKKICLMTSVIFGGLILIGLCFLETSLPLWLAKEAEMNCQGGLMFGHAALRPFLDMRRLIN